MSLAEIEAELGNLTPDELRRLALKSWTAFVDRERLAPPECVEDDPRLLAALDEADASPGQGLSGNEVRTRMAQWTSRQSSRTLFAA